MTDAVGPRRAELAVGAIVRQNNKLLLIKRGRPPGVGLWSLPGGRVEAGERLERAVEREVREEVGIEVTCGDFVGWVQRISDEYHFVIMDFLATSTHLEPSLQPSDDADDANWVELSEVGALDLVDGLEAFLSEHNLI